jgi:hypothetical protein
MAENWLFFDVPLNHNSKIHRIRVNLDKVPNPKRQGAGNIKADEELTLGSGWSFHTFSTTNIYNGTKVSNAANLFRQL